MSKREAPKGEAGQVYNVTHPFIKTTFTECDGEGLVESHTWNPGVRQEYTSPDGDSRAFADAVGQQVITVVSVHKPGKYPERIFYTRQWRDPSGKLFGKGLLHIRSAAQFTALVSGYRHGFQITGVSEAA